MAIGIEQPVNDTAPVHENILGTDISGTGHTIGRIALQLLPDGERALFETILSGKTTTKTVGYNGPATIYSDGTTDIQGRKRIVIDRNGFASYPATATAQTRTQITGVGARSGMVQRIATNKVYESKGTAEAIGSQRAAVRVRHRLEAQAGTQLSKAQDNFARKFRDPLVRKGQFPDLLKFSTTADSLLLKALQANRDQLSAPGRATRGESGERPGRADSRVGHQQFGVRTVERRNRQGRRLEGARHRVARHVARSIQG